MAYLTMCASEFWPSRLYMPMTHRPFSPGPAGEPWAAGAPEAKQTYVACTYVRRIPAI